MLAGFALVGAGLATIFPIAISAAGNLRGHDLSLNITSNLQGSLIRSLGRSILNAEACGK